MADEPVVGTDSTQLSEAQKRIVELNSKAKESEAAAAQEKQKREEAEAAVAEQKRIADFSEGFVDVVAQNPAAREFKDQIKEKVLGGYSLEDATFAVLGKAGKLGQPAPIVTPNSTAGGSATITPPSGGSKAVAEMTQAERRAALMEAEQRGDLGLSL